MFVIGKKKKKLGPETTETFLEATGGGWSDPPDTITDIPAGISSPHEITFGILMNADAYGLIPGAIQDETARFTRMN